MVVLPIQLPSATQRRDHVCLPLDFLNGWLFGVSTGHIRFENRDRLICYKRECYRVLHAAFQGQSNPVPSDPGRLVVAHGNIVPGSG